ncbi:MAG: PSD1 domain-containing protein [Verrucomicrobiales bacterium]|nr:PSD1 domain-containing protein [Verrucomicrobiales bacterium]
MLKPWISVGAVLLCAPGCSRSEEVFSAEQIQFFESKIRPVLVENCHRCHGPEHQNNGLRLDSRAAIVRGSDYGAVVTAGNPDASKLIHAIRQDQPGVEAMPRKASKLPQEAIDALTEWVKQGLPWPPESATPAFGSGASDPAQHWAYQKVVPPPIPVVQAQAQVAQPVDAFVIRKLEDNGLGLAPKADRMTRIKRLYADLAGFPPSYEEVQAFMQDPAPDAYSRLVERLLAAPHFGERWGRYWLDTARYADTKGYVFQEERRYPYAYTYRDWVIRALNADMPYDQFLINQLAADLTNPSVGGNQNLAALGFLTLGRRFLNNEPDIIDDRLDVTFRGMQAVTIGCARCHDHKNDPIPAQDYYSLYGVFASCMEPRELPEVGPAERTPEVVKFEEELAKKQTKVADYRRQRHARLFTEEAVEQYLATATECLGKPDGETRQVATDRGLYFNVVQRWQATIKQGETDSIFGLWNALIKVPPVDFAVRAKALIEAPDAEQKFLPELVREVKVAAPATLVDAAKVYARMFARAMPANGQSPAELEPVRRTISAPTSPMSVKPEDLEPFFTRSEREKLREIQKELETFKATSPAAPQRAMALQDKPQPVEPVVFIRGNPGRPGAKVPRQFLKMLSGDQRKPFTQGSGRLELARAIASPDNPLTARVFVNRAWAKLLGQPLVDTPSDFGMRTAPPANQPLLDHLAASFMRNGWSVKQLLREILLSATYQQQSLLRPDAAAKDPENRLCWRMNPKRLDFEAMRDSLLKVSGNLDPAQFGKSVDLLAEPFSHRRTIYGFIDRQNLPGTLRTFDFASPDQHASRRFETTVPQQALFFLNSRFVEQQAKRLAAMSSAVSAPDERVRVLTRQVLSRDATPDEIAAGSAFVQSALPASQTETAWSYGYGDWDAAVKSMHFTPFPWHGAGRWSGGETLPDPKLGFALLHAEGGHPGDPGKAAIRRWTAPRQATVNIAGQASVAQAQSGGILVRIISSRAGLLGEWKVAATVAVPITLERVAVTSGEWLDFVADCGGDTNCDGFHWVPRLVDAANGQEIADAQREFSGPGMAPDPWQSLAQALLCTNEFLFVD